MGETTDRDLYLDLYWIADAVFKHVCRENENKTMDLQKCSMINIVSVIEIFKNKVQKWILEAVWRLFCVSFVDAPVVLPKQITGKTRK